MTVTMVGTRTVLLAFGAALLLAGCQEDAAPRPIHLDKGVYRGTADTPRTADEVRALQERAAYQGVR